MEEERKKRKARKALQWHPAFFAGIQIELAEEAENLIFESEHQLGTKPMRMDTLIIKKEKELPIFKNIGRIFRKYNIMEYKSPKDYMGVDDFFKIYGYTYFYKADAPGENRIPITELTITMVGSHYPEKLFQYFREELGYETEAVEPGIYYVKGDRIPIQFIVTEMLLEEENPWLRSLTDHLESASLVDKLFSEYQKHDRNRLYESVIRAVVDANYEMFKEEESMDSFIRELFQDEIEEAERRAMQRGLEKGLKQGIEQGLEQGIEQGIEKGIEQGIEQGIEKGIEQGLEQGIEKGLEQGIERGLEKGIEQGKEQGINQVLKTLIEICKEIGLSREETESKVTSKLTLQSNQAQNYMEKYWSCQ